MGATGNRVTGVNLVRGFESPPLRFFFGLSLNRSPAAVDHGGMTENRREAVRITSGDPAAVEFSGRRVDAVLIDVSAVGARVRLTPPQLVPNRVVLTITLAGCPVRLPSHVWRAEPGALVALRFEDSENSALHRLIAEAQRHTIGQGIRPSLDRRRTRR